jgi:hypothetical protein
LLPNTFVEHVGRGRCHYITAVAVFSFEFRLLIRLGSSFQRHNPCANCNLMFIYLSFV